MRPAEVDPLKVTVLPIDDRSAWLESALRAWEMQAAEDGWNRPPRFGLLMSWPDGLGLAQIDIPRQALAVPHILFPELAKKSPRYVREVVGERFYAAQGMQIVGAALCSEAYGQARLPNTVLFRPARGAEAARVKVRRVIMVAPSETEDVLLLRQQGSTEPPQIRQGIPPESFAPGHKPDHTVRDALRAIVHKLCPPQLRP